MDLHGEFLSIWMTGRVLVVLQGRAIIKVDYAQCGLTGVPLQHAQK